MDDFKFLKEVQNVLVLGGTGDIGKALLNLIHNQSPEVSLFYNYRDEKKKLPTEMATGIELDINKENSWNNFFSSLPCQSIDLVISTIGFLHDSEAGPEKALKQVSLESMQKSFSVNYFANAMLAKHCEPLLKKSQNSALAFLSAKVGSIDDNKMGGWYSYRASKTALNMLAKNVSIEFKRKKMNTLVLSVHPGTTETELSTPFLKGVAHTIWEPKDTAIHIMKVIEGSSLEESGSFKNWDRTIIPW